MSVTINNKRASCGREVVGTWTHTEGTANESLTVAGYIYAGVVQVHDTAGPVDNGIQWSVSRSTTTGISTITIYCNQTVTDGRFWFYVSSL